MEHLTKSQIVLLTLFTTFVASVATAIVVVTLMQQAPEPITQTITNVVEKTIERAVPTIVEKPSKPVVIKDEDLLVAAIAQNSKNVIAFKVAGGDTGSSMNAGVGVVVSPDGLVITDRGNFGEGVLTTTIDGAPYLLEVLSDEKGNTLGLGRLKPIATSTQPLKFAVPTFGKSSDLKVGQTAVIIGGRDGKTIATGVITNLDTKQADDKGPAVLSDIGISQRLAGTSNGAPIITLDGTIVGFASVDDTLGTQRGVPVDEAQKLLNALSAATSTSGTSAASHL